MSANTIPDDVMRAAEACLPDRVLWYRSLLMSHIARALLAERQRCAKVAAGECAKFDFDTAMAECNDFSAGWNSGRLSAADAILNPPSAASSRAEQTGEVKSSQASPVTWITWNGGECPVPAGTKTEVKFRSGQVETDFTPEYWSWLHLEVASDIIAYRIVPNLTHEEAQ